jgi:hypothetical protein
MAAFDVMRQHCLHGPFTIYRSAHLPYPHQPMGMHIERRGRFLNTTPPGA